MYLFQRIRLYLDFAVMTTYKAVNIIPLKYVLIRQVQFLQVQWNQHFLIADMFILIKPTLLFIDILVNISSLLILYIKPYDIKKNHVYVRREPKLLFIILDIYIHSGISKSLSWLKALWTLYTVQINDLNIRMV